MLNSVWPTDLSMVSLTRTSDGTVMLEPWVAKELPWLVMHLSQQLSSHTLVHSHTASEISSGKKSGLMTSLRRRFHTPKVLTHLESSPPHQSKPSGKEKVFQLIEFPSKMLLSWPPVTDIHLSLIHNCKDRNGLRVELELTWSPSNFHKKDGWRELKWLSLMVMFSWLRLLERKLMLFLIHFSQDNSSRKESNSQSNSDLKMLTWAPTSNFISRLSWVTHITNQKLQPNAQSSTSSSLRLVLKINFWHQS